MRASVELIRFSWMSPQYFGETIKILNLFKKLLQFPGSNPYNTLI